MGIPAGGGRWWNSRNVKISCNLKDCIKLKETYFYLNEYSTFQIFGFIGSIDYVGKLVEPIICLLYV